MKCCKKCDEVLSENNGYRRNSNSNKFRRICKFCQYPHLKYSKKHDFCDVGLCLLCPRKYKNNFYRTRRRYLELGKLPRTKKTPKEAKEHTRQYEREKRRTDFAFRLGNNLRGRLRISLKSKKTIKSNSTMTYIGCSKEDLIKHLESKFKQNMSWDNYGKWHIDHIKPLSLFDLTNESEIYEAMHYSNLQPLWASENHKKHNKYLSTE